VQPPPFPPETPDSVLRDVENEYLTPSLDEDAGDVAKCGKMWDFDWFGEGEKQLQPMLSRFAVVPVWEPPYRRGKKPGEDIGGSSIAEWIPDFEEVGRPLNFCC
jgi:antiviral helicase SKI2